MKVLISGFDPFGKDTINPSIEAVKRLPSHIGDIEVIKVEIPTIAYECVKIMETYINTYNPDVIINVGQAGGRKCISIERVAININDFPICDNGGQTFIDKKIYEDGENAYFSTLPIRHILNELKDANIKAEISNSAGTFVCNHVMYSLAYLRQKQNKTYKSGFIHIPYLPEQTCTQACMPLDTIVQALTIVIKSACKEVEVGASN